MKRNITILGSTGSIGTQALEVISMLKDNFNIIGLSCGSNMELIKLQIEKYNPEKVCVKCEEDALKLIAKNASEKKTGARALRGVIDRVLADLMFEYGGYKENKVNLIVTKDMVQKYIEKTEGKEAA